jgi:membrane protein DedA with SNARE-associated domain
MNLQHALMYLVTNYPVLVYAVIIMTSFVEGPILALLCGVFYRLGFFHIVPIYFALMSGDLIGDCFWYWIGYRFGHRFIQRFGRYFSIHEKNVNKVETIFHTHKDSILLISKLTMGLGFALVTLVTAGLVRIPFKRYLTMNVLGQFIWTGLLLTLGYVFGNLYVSFNNIFARVSIGAFFVMLIVVMFGFGKYVRARIAKE